MVAVIGAAALFWLCVFAAYLTAQGISPLEFLIGARRPFDPSLAHWKVTGVEHPSGLIREERFLLPEGRQDASYLEHQVRYRDPTSRGIVKVESTKRVPRRRSESARDRS